MDLIKKCSAKISAYQRTHRGVPEVDLALEVIGVGVFANSTIRLMQKWHRATGAVKPIRKALTWMDNIDFGRHGNKNFFY